jgi:hypothetical protein
VFLRGTRHGRVEQVKEGFDLSECGSQLNFQFARNVASQANSVSVILYCVYIKLYLIELSCAK